MEFEPNVPDVDAAATGVEGEIGDLLGFETPQVEPEVVEPVVEPVSPEAEPVVESLPGEPVVEPQVVEPTITEPAVDDQLQLLMEQNKNLLKLVGELSEKVGTPKPSTSAPSNIGEEVTLEALLENIDFDEIMESKAKFMDFFKRAISTVRQDTVKELTGVIPQVVTPHIQQQVSLQEMHRVFYENNPELSGLKGYVTQLAQELSTNNPEWNIGKVLEETAKTAKANLGLNVIPNKPSSGGHKPALTGGTTGTRSKQSPVTDLQTEIDSILD